MLRESVPAHSKSAEKPLLHRLVTFFATFTQARTYLRQPAANNGTMTYLVKLYLKRLYIYIHIYIYE